MKPKGKGNTKRRNPTPAKPAATGNPTLDDLLGQVTPETLTACAVCAEVCLSGSELGNNLRTVLGELSGSLTERNMVGADPAAEVTPTLRWRAFLDGFHAGKGTD